MLRLAFGTTPRARLERLMRERRPIYRALGRRVVTTGHTPADVADRLARLLNAAPSR
jgi:shikimate kinase